MTREEIMELLYDDPEVYRPPLENESALLEVTHGCSWGKCTFCDFARDPYYRFDMEDIENKIKLLRQVIDGNHRIYFLGSNPFSLPLANELSFRLCHIAQKLKYDVGDKRSREIPSLPGVQ